MEIIIAMHVLALLQARSDLLHPPPYLYRRQFNPNLMPCLLSLFSILCYVG